MVLMFINVQVTSYSRKKFHFVCKEVSITAENLYCVIDIYIYI